MTSLSTQSPLVCPADEAYTTAADLVEIPQAAVDLAPVPRPIGTRRGSKARPAAPQTALPATRGLQTGEPLVFPAGNLSVGYRVAKRLMDIVGALGLLVLLAPVMLGVLLVLLVTTRGRPLFCQRRAGYRGRPFWMFKFRTMVAGAAERQFEVHNELAGPVFKNHRDPRVTRLGRLLRRTSLDETPQLLHVLCGRMSLVGPRPLPMHEASRLRALHRHRLAVKPGLTCLWQVSGRSEIGFEEWMRLDLWYVGNQSLWTDLSLLLRTPVSVLWGRGAY